MPFPEATPHHRWPHRRLDKDASGRRLRRFRKTPRSSVDAKLTRCSVLAAIARRRKKAMSLFFPSPCPSRGEGARRADEGQRQAQNSGPPLIRPIGHLLPIAKGDGEKGNRSTEPISAPGREGGQDGILACRDLGFRYAYSYKYPCDMFGLRCCSGQFEAVGRCGAMSRFF
jgi:hypothetical protein